jgi:hypothetical protein
MSSTQAILSLLQAASTALEAAKKLMETQTPLSSPPQTPQAPMKTEENWESVSDGWPAEELDFEAEAVAVEQPVAEPKVWSVHDCHTHLKGKNKGIWARVAVANGTYGVCVGITKDSKETTNEKILGPLGEVTVSKRRWNNAKGISVGDYLFMGDTHIKKVFKGTVTAQPVTGPFCPLGNVEDSFIASLGAVTDERLAREVEVVFKVDWTEIGPLNEDWYKYLGTGRLVTVSPLTTAPPA